MLTREELLQIEKSFAAAIAQQRAAVRDSDFYIPPKEHYDQHKRLDRMLDAYEGAQNQFWKWVIGIVLSGGLAFALLGAKVKGLFS